MDTKRKLGFSLPPVKAAPDLETGVDAAVDVAKETDESFEVNPYKFGKKVTNGEWVIK
jgi:hypothetical protein